MEHARYRYRSRPRRPRQFSIFDLAAMVLVGMAGGLGWALLPVMSSAVSTTEEAQGSAATHASFGFCHSGGGQNCVVDGDTFWMGGVKIRIADIDTPETHPARCPHEAELGAAATRRLHALLNGGAVSLEPIGRDSDRYGRKLRIVSIDGQGVGETLVGEGLARRYEGGRRAGWCD